MLILFISFQFIEFIHRLGSKKHTKRELRDTHPDSIHSFQFISFH